MDSARDTQSVRRAGVLLHPTSLPGDERSGAIGVEAINFLNFLSAAGIGVWQMLPVGPTHDDGSPYQGLSVHAGNPELICQQWLINEGLLDTRNLESHQKALEQACERFFEKASTELLAPWYRFLEDHAGWLEDYALFQAIRGEQNDLGWWDWPKPLRDRDAMTLERARRRLATQVRKIQFEQFVFFRQWEAVRTHAAKLGIRLFGDMPIFVAHDSADVWQHQRLFNLDESGQPVAVAGVPPDYFSATGQRWGNPLYDWPAARETGYAWWKERMRSAFAMFDMVRIDHFRGFHACWEIPAQCETAQDGVWVPGPGAELFASIRNDLGRIELVAEDLGVITDDVIALRDTLQLPGMKILQFAFDGNQDNPYLPHNHEKCSVVYTGTHDNDTTVGWAQGLNDAQYDYVREYLGHTAESMPWPLIRAALASVADLAVVPLQDLLELPTEHRMNIPGTTDGNWTWRFQWEQVSDELPGRIRRMLQLYNRQIQLD